MHRHRWFNSRYRYSTTMQMVASYFIFLAFCLIYVSQPIKPANQTDLLAALEDMRSSSYHGFVILLQMLNRKPNSLQDKEMTFLMPSDAELSNFVITPDSLHEFLLSHSVPTAFLFDNLKHLPSGTVLPSSYPNKAINLKDDGNSVISLNNAKFVKPNVCSSFSIKCNGITEIIKFENQTDSPRVVIVGNPAVNSSNPPMRRDQASRNWTCGAAKRKKSPSTSVFGVSLLYTDSTLNRSDLNNIISSLMET